VVKAWLADLVYDGREHTVHCGEHVPAGLVDVQVPGGGVALGDRLRQRAQQPRARREHPSQGALSDVEPVVVQRGDDPVRGAAQHELLIRKSSRGRASGTTGLAWLRRGAGAGEAVVRRRARG